MTWGREFDPKYYYFKHDTVNRTQAANYSKLFVKESPTRCNNVSKFYYSIFIWSSTCFGRHTAHHQEPKTALAASGFSYVEGCLDVQLEDVVRHTVPDDVFQLHVQTAFHLWKTRGCQCSFRLLMMYGVSP